MPTKISNATKRLALEKLRGGLSAKDVAKLSGVSERTVERWKAAIVSPSALPSGTTAPPTSAPPDADTDAKPTLDFQESPAPVVESKGIIDNAFSSLKGMLGLADKKNDTTAPPLLGAKLDAKRQQFVDSASPTLSLVAMAVASWMWGRIGPEYSHLAPDEKVAQRIVEPLLRVYARHANFMTDINPDVADVGASMFALVAYVYAALGMYQQMKAEKEDDDGQNQESTFAANRRRFSSPQPENRTSNQGGRSADVRGTGGSDASPNGGNGGRPPSVNLPHLSDKEARQHEALSRLAELDYQSRARRSGRA